MAYRFELVEGTDAQIRILYELLKNRIHSISHSELPNYDVHSRFVKLHPYHKWYLVSLEQECLGSFYVKTDNSIGLNLNQIDEDIVMSCINFIRHNFCPRQASASMVSDNFYINVATTNLALIEVMHALSISQLQVSFEI
jgi:hypothetical protein